MKTPSIPFILALLFIATVAAVSYHDLQEQRRALRLSLARAAFGYTGEREDRARRDEFLRASGWDEARIAADRNEQALGEIQRELARVERAR